MTKRLGTLILTIFFILSFAVSASATGYNISFNLNHKDGDLTLTLNDNDIHLSTNANNSGANTNMNGEFPEAAESIVKYFKSQSWEKDPNYDPNKPGYTLSICPEDGFCEEYMSNNMPRDLINIEDSELFTMLEENVMNFIQGIFKLIGIIFLFSAIFFVVIFIVIIKAIKGTAKMSTDIIRDVNSTVGRRNITITRTSTGFGTNPVTKPNSESSDFVKKERKSEKRNSKDNPFEL